MTSRFELDCTDCSFQVVVVGEFSTVFETVDAHRRAVRADPGGHFVNVHRRA